MVKKKERKWRGSECFGKPLYLKLFLQGWAWLEIEAWTAWSRRNIWKQHGHPRGPRKIATYRVCTGKRVAEEANVLNSICQCCTVCCWGFSGSSMASQRRCSFSTSLRMTHLTIAIYSTACLAAPWPREGSSVFSAKEAATGTLAGWSARAQAV